MLLSMSTGPRPHHCIIPSLSRLLSVHTLLYICNHPVSHFLSFLSNLSIYRSVPFGVSVFCFPSISCASCGGSRPICLRQGSWKPLFFTSHQAFTSSSVPEMWCVCVIEGGCCGDCLSFAWEGSRFYWQQWKEKGQDSEDSYGCNRNLSFTHLHKHTHQRFYINSSRPRSLIYHNHRWVHIVFVCLIGLSI